MNQTPATRRLMISALAVMAYFAINGAAHAAPAPQNVAKMAAVAAATQEATVGMATAAKEALVINGAHTYNTGPMHVELEQFSAHYGTMGGGLNSAQVVTDLSMAVGIDAQAVGLGTDQMRTMGGGLSGDAAPVMGLGTDAQAVFLSGSAVSFVLAAASEWPDLSVSLSSVHYGAMDVGTNSNAPALMEKAVRLGINAGVKVKQGDVAQTLKEPLGELA